MNVRILKLAPIALIAGLAFIALSSISESRRMPAEGPPLERIYWTVKLDRLEALGDEIEKFGNEYGIEVFRSTNLPLDVGIGFNSFILFVTRAPLAKDISRPFVSVAVVRIDGIDPVRSEIDTVIERLKTQLMNFDGLVFKQDGESW